MEIVIRSKNTDATRSLRFLLFLLTFNHEVFQIKSN